MAPSLLPVAVASVLASIGCTDASLYGKVGQAPNPVDKIALTGVLCTDNPATRKFPVKILFLVDASGRMTEAAPLGEHVNAIEAVVSQYLPIANVSIGVIRYDDKATQLISEMRGRFTSGFTRDDALIDAALANLRTGSGARDLASAMSLARSVITGEVFQADKGPLARTKYVVVNIMSGSPEPPISAASCNGLFNPQPPVCEPAFLEKSVRDLRDLVLTFGAAEFSFHNIYLEEPQIEGPPCDPTLGGQCGLYPLTVCVQAGARRDTGRCVQQCDPTSPVCTAFSNRTVCTTVALPGSPTGTNVNYCGRGEAACFDGVNNDRDGLDRDCSDPTYPYGCAGAGRCEDDCRSACRTEKIGLAMSLVTGGRYERFTYSDQTSLGRIDFRSTQRLFVKKEFLAFNRNAIATANGFFADTDADGLSDLEEDRLGLAPMNADMDGDFFNDKLEHTLRTLGMDPVVTTTIADCPDPSIDTDGDGLRDCEEKLLGSDATLFDTDADGFPDHVEFRVGTNPLANDNLEDLDLDGINNGRETRVHTDPLSNDSTVRAELAYRYRTVDLGTTNDERYCYDFRVSNITLVETRDRGFGSGNNDIDVYFGQVPDSALESFGVFHVAQMRVQYLPPDRRIPDAPALDLEESDFVSFEQ